MFEVKIGIEDEFITDEVLEFANEANLCTELYSKKNHDYGNSFDKGMDTIGMPYGVGRIYDKMNRLVTLTKEEAAIKDESIDDTLRDLACYSIMMLTYRKRQRNNRLKEVELN